MAAVIKCPYRIFIGYDSKEPIAYHVLSHSIFTRSSIPVVITPLVQPALRQAEIYTRERNPLESTEFSLTRFLTPFLCDYRGVAVFMDCDMLCLGDIAELIDIALANTGVAVSVCQHSYEPRTSTKFLGQQQTVYPRKNWSSLMVFDCSHFGSRALTPEYVNATSPLELHRLMWSREAIGAIPLDWNWLVGEYEPNPHAKMLHYTLGGPWFPEYAKCDHSTEWWEEHRKVNSPCLALAH